MLVAPPHEIIYLHELNDEIYQFMLLHILAMIIGNEETDVVPLANHRN